ncbi:chlorocatechol-degradation protein [Stereum hirsutum FP-91666 SS1]|uniref:chlorocatechol-degradation protein n=1 Tax=Stereum hirsutum (strain FP-91666) TaxID=721885 RepID=UPI000440D8DF|nr:chlorocatechol-degradation protein [Stereum hirsutum FP-91666 SS1]EIM90826.1 chlorocatechol-degradation protein [Stereum hirsutum FP-91666 SS1]
MSFCQNCVEGVRHEGATTGTYETVGGIKTYVATPSGDYAKDKALIYIPDIFGQELNNNLLLADAYAKNGVKVYFPDIFAGDAAPADALTPGSGWDLRAWASKHTAKEIMPILESLMQALTAQGVTKFAATGYCFGARFVFNLAFENKIAVSITAHPSQLQIEDLEKYAQISKAALLINSCTHDPMFTSEKIEAADRLLGEKFEPGYERAHWEGCSHGFAVRGDISDPVVKAGKEGAFKKSVEFLKKYL